MGNGKRLATLSMDAAPGEGHRSCAMGQNRHHKGPYSRDPGMLRDLSRALCIVQGLFCTLLGAVDASFHVYLM
jgi:hypothetical protein